jgi:hypothetical protein
MSWVTDIINAITSTFTNLGTAVFNFLKDGFVTLFLKTDAQGAVTGVSELGIFGFVLMGLSLVLGLTYFITNLVRRKI